MSYPAAYDFESFDGEENKAALKLSAMCLGLGMPATIMYFRGCDSRYMIVDLDDFKVRIPLGRTLVEATKTLKRLAPKIMTDAEGQNEESVEDITMDVHGHIGPDEHLSTEQEAQALAMIESTMLQKRLASMTEEFVGRVH